MREAAMRAMRESNYEKTIVLRKHFDDAMAQVRPSISEDDVKAYDGFAERRARVSQPEKRTGYV